MNIPKLTVVLRRDKRNFKAYAIQEGNKGTNILAGKDLRVLESAKQEVIAHFFGSVDRIEFIVEDLEELKQG